MPAAPLAGLIRLRADALARSWRPAPVKRPIALSSLYDDLVEAGQKPATVLPRCEEVQCSDEVAAALRPASGSEALFAERLRKADDKPIALMENYLPLGPIDGVESRLETTGLYRLFRAAGIDLRVATQRIGAAAAERRQGELLEVPEGGPLLTMERTAYDGSGRAVECCLHVYPACRYSCEMTLVSR